MRKCRHQGLGAVVLSLGIATAGCGKVKALIGLDKGDSGAGAQAAANSVPALDSFEGELGLMIKPGPKERQTAPIPPINLLVKAGKVRIDVPNDIEQLKSIGKVYVVIAALDKKLFAVLDDKKEVVLVELDKIGEHINRMKPPSVHEPHNATTAPKPPKITKTGHKDKIAGHDCEDWEIAADTGGKALVCVAERGVAWLKMPSLGLPAEQAWMAELLDGRHFPLRVVAYEKDGIEAGRIEVTKLEQKPLAAQLFEMPAGYRTVELQQAIQEMMSAAMGGHAMPPGMAEGHAQGLPPGMAAQLPPEIAARIKAAQHPPKPAGASAHAAASAAVAVPKSK